MKKLNLIGIVAITLLLALSSCRPPELEGAFVHFKNGRIDQALTLAEKVTTEHPANPEGWYLLGQLYGKKDRIADMMKAYDKSLELAKTFEQKISIDKQTYFASKFNGGVQSYNKYLKLEDHSTDEAKKVMMSAIKRFTDANIIKESYGALNLINQGYNLIGESDKALEGVINLTTQYPDSAKAWLTLGKFYYDQKAFDKAAENFEKATEIDGENSEALTYLAQTYDFLNMPEKAIPAYKKAIEVNEGDSAIPFNLGLLLYKAAVVEGIPEETKTEKLNMAIEFFEKSIEINPDFKSSYQLKGNAELQNKKFEDAKETLEEGVELFPEDAQMWIDLAKSYTFLNEKDKATAAFQRADELEK
jgi:tetratricopeptide (TPR) repeat protein